MNQVAEGILNERDILTRSEPDARPRACNKPKEASTQMGNNQTRVGIRLDKQNYVAGDVLRGRVYLSKLGNDTYLDGNRWVSLSLQLEGIEHVEGAEKERSDHEHDRDSRTPQYTIHRLREPFLRTEYPLIETTSQGQREYPFELPLPGDLPSSMRCSKDERNHCEIQYNVSVLLHDRNRRLLQQDTVYFGVTANAGNIQPQPICMEEETFPIKMCCCNDKGVIAMGWNCDTNITTIPNGSFRIHVYGRNYSSQRIRDLRIQLKEVIRWRVPGLRYEVKDENTLAEQRISVDGLSEWKPSRNDKYLLANERPASRTGVLNVPHFARDSYDGRNMSVRHLLIVTAQTEGTCVTKPDLTTTVRLVRTGREVPSALNTLTLPYAEVQLLPTDWTPVQNEVILIPQASAVVTDSSPYALDENIGGEHWVEPILTPSAPSELYDRRSIDPISTDSTISQLTSIIVSNTQNLSAYLDSPTMRNVIRELSPRDYARLLEAAGPANLRTVAPSLASMMNFTTRHLLSSLFSFPSDRILLLEETSPYAVDFAQHYDMVEQELDPSELEYFRALVQRGPRRSQKK